MKLKILFFLLVLMTFSSPVSAQKLAQKRFWKSKKFWVTFSMTTASMVADYRTSQTGIKRGGVESDPIFGSSHPSMFRMTAVGLPINFGYVYLGYRMSKSRHKPIRDIWLVPAAYFTISHSQLAFHNTTMCPNKCN